MKKTLFIITVILLISSSVLTAAFVYNRQTGYEINAFSARSLALGSTGLTSSHSVMNALKNSAIISGLSGKYGIQINNTLTKNDEDRSFPIYDSFNSWIDDAVYASNSHFFNNVSTGAYWNHELTEGVKFSTTFNFAPVYDFNFKYEENVRNNQDTDNDNEPEKIAMNRYKGDGTIDSYTGSFALSLQNDNNIFSALSLGIGISYLDGNNTIDSTIIFTDWAKERMEGDPDSLHDVIYHQERKYSGTQLNFGLLATISKRLKIGASYLTQAELHQKTKTNNDTTWARENVRYPAKYGVGMVYMPRNMWRTKLYIDMKYTTWSDYSAHYDDIIEYFAGIEHDIFNSVPLRLGFRYQPTAKDDEITLTSFSAGTAFSVYKSISLDLGMEIGTMNYKHKDLFPDSNYANASLWNTQYDDLPVDRTNPDNVDDNLISTMATINWKF